MAHQRFVSEVRETVINLHVGQIVELVVASATELTKRHIGEVLEVTHTRGCKGTTVARVRLHDLNVVIPVDWKDERIISVRWIGLAELQAYLNQHALLTVPTVDPLSLVS